MERCSCVHDMFFPVCKNVCLCVCVFVYLLFLCVYQGSSTCLKEAKNADTPHDETQNQEPSGSHQHVQGARAENSLHVGHRKGKDREEREGEGRRRGKERVMHRRVSVNKNRRVSVNKKKPGQG